MSKSTQEAMDCLKLSIELAKTIYKEEFQYYVCTNGLDDSSLEFIKNFGVPVIRQEDHLESLPILPDFCAWKFYPPRISSVCHEIYIDNDIIIQKRMPSIDRFLCAKNCLIQCEGLGDGFFGQYENNLIQGRRLNAGLIGVPPGFDLGTEITKRILGPWKGHFDDQGMFSQIAADNDCIIIPLTEMHICDDWTNNWINNQSPGLHFVGLNRGRNKLWIEFLKQRSGVRIFL